MEKNQVPNPLPIQYVWYRTDWLTALVSLGLAWGHIRGITHMVATSAFITDTLLPIRAFVTFLLFTGTSCYVKLSLGLPN
jgi:hypothetical protein